MSEYLSVYQRTYGQASTDKLSKPKDKYPRIGVRLIAKLKYYLLQGRSLGNFKNIGINFVFMVTGLLVSQIEIRSGILPVVLSLLLAFKMEKSRYFFPLLIGSVVGIVWQFGFVGIFPVLFPLILFQGWQKSRLANHNMLGLFLFAMVYFVIDLAVNHDFNRLFSVSVLAQHIIAAVLIILFSVLLLPAIKKIEQGFTEWSLGKEELISFIILGSMIFLGLQGFYIDGYSLARVVAMLIVLSLGYCYGGGVGASAGTILGIATGFYSLSQISIGLFALSGLFSGIFKDFGKVMSIIAFLCSGSLVVFYFGEPYIIMTILQELLIVSALFMVLPKSWLGVVFPEIPGSKNDENVSKSKAGKIINYKIGEFACLFKEMAHIFECYSNGEDNSSDTELEDFIHMVVERVCDGCSKMEYCWENNFFETYKQFLTAMSEFDNINDLQKGELPDYLLESCIRSSLLKENIRGILEQRQLENTNKVTDPKTQKILSEQMRGISDLLQKMSLYKFVDTCLDEELQNGVSKIVADLGYDCEEVRVTKEENGELNIELMLTKCSYSENINASNLISKLSQLTGRKLSIVKQEKCGNKHQLLNDRYFIRITTARQLTVASGKAQLNKWDENFNGDNCVSKELSTGEHLLLLSDGMGSGSNANQESNAVVTLITKLLDYGFEKKMVINAANSLLSVINRVDSFATVDMAIIDLYTGIGEFCKAGAVASFIRTFEGIEKVDAGALPAGIIDSVEPKQLTYNLKSGDYLIMVSDGVYELGQDDEWLQNILIDLPPLHPQKMAEKIMDKVKRRYHYRKLPDDVTVVVSQINDNSSAEMLS